MPECMLAPECVFVCSRCAKETSLTSPRRACPWDGGKRGREERGSGMEKGRECEDEMKGKINSFVKEREKRGKIIGKERELDLVKKTFAQWSLQHLPPNLTV